MKCIAGRGFKVGHAYLVQVPDARGSLIPEIASMRDDFPAL